MASCKNCVHFEICDGGSSIDEFMEQGTYTDGVEKECEYFKDHTRFVELPCGTEGWVYIINDDEEIEEVGVQYFMIDDNASIFPEKTIVGMDNGCEYYPKELFLTHKEAEKALKERGKNDT